MQELINEYRGALQDVQKVKANLQKKLMLKNAPYYKRDKKELFKKCQKKLRCQN